MNYDPPIIEHQYKGNVYIWFEQINNGTAFYVGFDKAFHTAVLRPNKYKLAKNGDVRMLIPTNHILWGHRAVDHNTYPALKVLAVDLDTLRKKLGLDPTLYVSGIQCSATLYHDMIVF